MRTYLSQEKPTVTPGCKHAFFNAIKLELMGFTHFYRQYQVATSKNVVCYWCVGDFHGRAADSCSLEGQIMLLRLTSYKLVWV